MKNANLVRKLATVVHIQRQIYKHWFAGSCDGLGWWDGGG